MATTSVTANPYTYNIKEDTIIVPTYEEISYRFVIQRGNSPWQGSVGGQGNISDAFNAGFAFLDSHDVNYSGWTNIIDRGIHSEYIGRDIAYRETVWQPFRVWLEYPFPDASIAISFRSIDGGNGEVTMSSIREHSQWHKDFVLEGNGGDKGHYGESSVTITLTAPRLGTYSYKCNMWMHSD